MFQTVVVTLFILILNNSVAIANELRLENLKSDFWKHSNDGNPLNNIQSEERIYTLSYAQNIKANNPYIKIILAVYERANLKVKLVPLPPLRALKSADLGVVDAEVGYSDKIMGNYPNLLKVDASLYSFYGRAYTVNPDILSFAQEDAPNYRIGVKRGSFWYQDIIKGINVTKVETCNQLFDILIADRIDIGLCPDGVFQNQIKEIRERHKSVRALTPPIVALPIFHYVHKKNIHLIPLLEKTILEMIDEGLIDPKKSWLK